jgi:hypothetical protein
MRLLAGCIRQPTSGRAGGAAALGLEGELLSCLVGGCVAQVLCTALWGGCIQYL